MTEERQPGTVDEPGMGVLHARLVHAPAAKMKIAGIDSAAAEAVGAVVLTGSKRSICIPTMDRWLTSARCWRWTGFAIWASRSPQLPRTRPNLQKKPPGRSRSRLFH